MDESQLEKFSPTRAELIELKEQYSSLSKVRLHRGSKARRGLVY